MERLTCLRAASQSLDVYVSRVRKALRRAGAEGVLATRTPGYVLHAEETDAAQFEAQVGAGRAASEAGDCDRAASVLRDGLALWRGNAYVEVADEPWARLRSSVWRSCASPRWKTGSMRSWRSVVTPRSCPSSSCSPLDITRASGSSGS